LQYQCFESHFLVNKDISAPSVLARELRR